MHKPLSSIQPLADFAAARAQEDPAGTRELFNALMGAASRSDPYGRDPHDPTPPANWADFDPRFVAILYLRLEPNWKIAVNHASYPVPAGNDDEDRLVRAVEVLQAKVQTGLELGDPELRHLGPYLRQQPGPEADRDYDSGTFANFKFGSQNETFIYLHHPNVELTMYETALIAFKNQGSDGMPRHQNYCFFNTRVVPAAAMAGLDAEGTLIRMENYATKENGSLLQAPETRDYSIDIKIQVDGGSAGLITLIIDPDTGNGTGNEP